MIVIMEKAFSRILEFMNYVEDKLCLIVEFIITLIKCVWLPVIYIYVFVMTGPQRLLVTILVTIQGISFLQCAIMHYFKGIPWKKTFLFRIF